PSHGDEERRVVVHHEEWRPAERDHVAGGDEERGNDPSELPDAVALGLVFHLRDRRRDAAHERRKDGDAEEEQELPREDARRSAQRAADAARTHGLVAYRCKRGFGEERDANRAGEEEQEGRRESERAHLGGRWRRR